MIRRSLGAALWTLVGLLAGFLGALSSLVGTGAGRSLLARVSEGALQHVFTGAVEIGDAGGSLLTGVTLHDVRLFDADTTLVAFLPQANISYNPFDFAAGRIVLFEFELDRPVINLVQHRDGRLNIEELLRIGAAAPKDDKGPRGPAAFILFRNVRVTDGSVTLRLQASRAQPGDSSLEIETGGPNGRMRVRRFQHLNTRISALQISSPRQRGIRIDVTGLAVESSDPVARLVDVRHDVLIGHSSLRHPDHFIDDVGRRPARMWIGIERKDRRGRGDEQQDGNCSKQSLHGAPPRALDAIDEPAARSLRAMNFRPELSSGEDTRVPERLRILSR